MNAMAKKEMSHSTITGRKKNFMAADGSDS